MSKMLMRFKGKMLQEVGGIADRLLKRAPFRPVGLQADSARWASLEPSSSTAKPIAPIVRTAAAPVMTAHKTGPGKSAAAWGGPKAPTVQAVQRPRVRAAMRPTAETFDAHVKYHERRGLSRSSAVLAVCEHRPDLHVRHVASLKGGRRAAACGPATDIFWSSVESRERSGMSRDRAIRATVVANPGLHALCLKEWATA